MKQYIKIEANNEKGLPLGTFKLSIDEVNPTGSMISVIENNEEILLDSLKYNLPSNIAITLYNVPIVYQYDYITPIQFNENIANNVNILLLEDKKYFLSFKPSEEFKKELKDCDIFYSLLKFSNYALELIPSPNCGVLQFSSYVGKSFLDIYKNNKSIFEIPFEVRSRKIDYANQYASMIGDLSKYSQNLIYESNSPSTEFFELSDISENKIYEEFMLLEYLFKDENLPSTIEYLSRNLYSALSGTVEEVPTSFASNVNPNDLIDVFSNSHNLSKSKDVDSIWCKQTKGYIPLTINETKYVDDIDVPENRFYKNFLESIENLIHELSKKAPEGYIKDQLLIYKETISAYLAQKYFKDISRMDYMPLNSQLLQKKEGYRDILEYYLMFEFGFRLNWDELFDKFKGNEKKVYELYEYWCFFELVNILNARSSKKIDMDDIFFKSEESKIDNFTIVLNKNQNITFEIEVEGRTINVDLRYNTEFDRGKKIFKTYSKLLKPDYSLIINIDHRKYILHFDAKYKLNIENESYVNDDLVKMHAYKDAILNTVGAYVLYPGENKEIFWEDKDKKLESVGAFPLNPGENNDDEEYLSDFIFEMIKKLI